MHLLDKKFIVLLVNKFHYLQYQIQQHGHRSGVLPYFRGQNSNHRYRLVDDLYIQILKCIREKKTNGFLL